MKTTRGEFTFFVRDSLIGTGELHCPLGWQGLPLNRAYFCPRCATVWALAHKEAKSPTAFSTVHRPCRSCGGSGRLWTTSDELATFSRSLLRYELFCATSSPVAYRSTEL